VWVSLKEVVLVQLWTLTYLSLKRLHFERFSPLTPILHIKINILMLSFDISKNLKNNNNKKSKRQSPKNAAYFVGACHESCIFHFSLFLTFILFSLKFKNAFFLWFPLFVVVVVV
jgi:hypothetical protein